MKIATVCAAAGLAVATGTLVLGVDAFALDRPKPGADDSRVRFVDYQPFNVVRVIGSIRSSVQVEFSADEEISNVAVGNTVAWEVAVSGNIMFLKAREVQPATNAQVVTTRKDGSRRSYQLELVVDGDVGTGLVKASTAGEQLSGTYFYVKFRYPADEAAAAKAARAEKVAQADAGRADRILSFDEMRGPRNWRYTARGAKAIEPLQVYDNGKITTFAFVANQEMPAITIENTDGSESLVPKTVAGELVHVHAVGAKFILRRGNDVLAIYNQAFDGLGINPGTNTTSPAVERVVSGKAVAASEKRMEQGGGTTMGPVAANVLPAPVVLKVPQSGASGAPAGAVPPAVPPSGWTPVGVSAAAEVKK